MSLAAEYHRQYAFRDWASLLANLPFSRGERVIDVGCAVGDQARDLAALGLRVLGLDANDELLDAARSRGLENVEFEHADLRGELSIEPAADGLWCSFAAAYFIDLASTLSRWTRCVRPGGHVVLIEIDGLFDHAPVAPRTRELLDRYAEASVAAGRYDFAMGHRLADHATRAGLEVLETTRHRDREFTFDGAATADVLAAWNSRFDRMTLLRAHCGDEFAAVRDDFLRCLAAPDHSASCAVVRCIARKPT